MAMTTHNVSTKELRKFGLTTGAIVLVLFGVLFPWLLGRGTPTWPWVLGGVLIAWGIVAPATLRLVYRGWMAFGHIMSKITTPIILSVVFYGAVLPTGFVRRLLGLDSMARAFDDAKPSYRIESRKTDKQNLKRPF
jgi:hypothetical protein